jgi:hypothetical protein
MRLFDSGHLPILGIRPATGLMDELLCVGFCLLPEASCLLFSLLFFLRLFEESGTFSFWNLFIPSGVPRIVTAPSASISGRMVSGIFVLLLRVQDRTSQNELPEDLEQFPVANL